MFYRLVVLIAVFLLAHSLSATAESIESQDQELAAHFSDPEAFPDAVKKESGWFVKIKQEGYIQARTWDGGAHDLVKRKKLAAAGTDDPVKSAYLTAVKSRGGIVKMYSPKVNSQIIKAIIPTSNSESKYPRHRDWDNALIEYGSNGEMVSALVRQNSTTTFFYDNAACLDMSSFVIFGDGIKSFAKKTDIKDLEPHFVRSL